LYTLPSPLPSREGAYINQKNFLILVNFFRVFIFVLVRSRNSGRCINVADIIPLHLCPEYAPILAYWAYREWYQDRSVGFDVVLKAYLGRVNDDSLPQCLVAVEDSFPVGMVTLKLDELWSRKDLNPWLSSLFVDPARRNRGIGAELVRAVLARSTELGYDGAYLFIGRRGAARLERYYARLGWAFVDNAVDNDGYDTKILHCSAFQVSW
jgi:GNAT superfamily N-acetyltransferase